MGVGVGLGFVGAGGFGFVGVGFGFAGVGGLYFVGVGLCFVGVLIFGLVFAGTDTTAFVGAKVGATVGAADGSSVGVTDGSSVGLAVACSAIVGSGVAVLATSVCTGSVDSMSEGKGVDSDTVDTVGDVSGSDVPPLPGITKATNNIAIKLNIINPLIIFKILRYFSLLSIISHLISKFLTIIKSKQYKIIKIW